MNNEDFIMDPNLEKNFFNNVFNLTFTRDEVVEKYDKLVSILFKHMCRNIAYDISIKVITGCEEELPAREAIFDEYGLYPDMRVLIVDYFDKFIADAKRFASTNNPDNNADIIMAETLKTVVNENNSLRKELDEMKETIKNLNEKLVEITEAVDKAQLTSL